MALKRDDLDRELLPLDPKEATAIIRALQEAEAVYLARADRYRRDGYPVAAERYIADGFAVRILSDWIIHQRKDPDE